MATINERFDELGDDINAVQRQLAVLAEQMRAMREETVGPLLRDHASRLTALERWQWRAMGAAAAVGALGGAGVGWLGLIA